MSSDKKEECGVFAIYSKTGADIAPLLYKGLFALQHRGQDAAGFAVYNDGRFYARKGLGLVNDIFKPEDFQIKGNVGIGHTRYPTIGNCNQCDVQPTVYGEVAVAHNGHIANYDSIKEKLEKEGYKYESTVDSEPMAFVFDKNRGDIEKSALEIIETFEGAFSDVVIAGGKLAIFRDRFALRPLVWGETRDFVCFASESAALDINNIPYCGSVRGGELIIINGKMERKSLVPENRKHCMFEYVYFSRPDSTINGLSVHEVRGRLGKILAREAPVKADVVVPVPDTSRTAALAMANAFGISYDEGLIKNRYIGRTFIMPTQEKRRDAVKLKLNALKEVLQGKSIVLVDDSIIRGTTLKEIVSMIKQAGAKEVHVRITCPPVKAPCFYGVDIQTYRELIANKKTIDEIRVHLGADSLSYISLEGLKEAIGIPICHSCLTNEYHTEFVKKQAQKTKESE
ncbi:amidophosphoribosyltransferase [Candidatus Micrarchaeota archaeon]|nr:amidophosphoribosyltransferase [Candidatus Micrarchaeota archaeon]